MRLFKHLSFFGNKFNIFNYTGALMLDSTYQMSLKLLGNHIFGIKKLRVCHYVRKIVTDVIT